MDKLKRNIVNAIKEEYEERLQLAIDALEGAIESRNRDTKSSAGDKYETSREMIQQEINSSEKQIYQIKMMLNELKRLPILEKPLVASSGSLVETNYGLYFLGLSAGKVEVEGETVYAISIASPLGKLLFNKKIGDVINLNNSEQTIIDLH